MGLTTLMPAFTYDKASLAEASQTFFAAIRLKIVESVDFLPLHIKSPKDMNWYTLRYTAKS